MKRIKKITYYAFVRLRLQSFARIHFWGETLQSRFSPFGRWMLLFLLATIMFGGNTKFSMLFQLFALNTSLIIISLTAAVLKGIRRTRKIEINRVLPRFATVGEWLEYNIKVYNKAKTALINTRIEERSKLPMPSVKQFLERQEPGEEKRNWYDRKVGFYRFVWLVKWLRGAKIESSYVDRLAPQLKSSIKMRLLPERRGVVSFGAVRVGLSDPLGLAYSFHSFHQPQTLCVLPRRYTIPAALALNGGRKYQQGGVSQSSAIGESGEFSRLREYRTGDSMRHMVWASIARGTIPLVKEFQDDFFTRHALVLDSFAETTYREVFEEAVSLAAGFADASMGEDSLVDLMFVGAQNKVEQLTIGRALATSEHMLKGLASVQLCQSSQFTILAAEVAAQGDRFGSCVLILLHWDDARKELVHQLLAQSVAIRIFLVQAKESSKVRNTKAQQSAVIDFPEFLHVLSVGNIEQGLSDIVRGIS